MDPRNIDEKSLEVIDGLIRETLNSLETKQPTRGLMVRYALTRGLGEIDVAFEGDLVVTRLKYHNPKIKPVDLFTIGCQLEEGNETHQLWKVIRMEGDD